MKSIFGIVFLLIFHFNGAAAAELSPAQMISNFRLKHGEQQVTIDETLNRIARQQAEAMAAKDTLDHEVLGSFNSRVASAKAGRAAENIAYGYDRFDKTLDQWIASTSHRSNLLLHNASRVGIASAKSSSSQRTYWAMEIAGDYDLPKTVSGKKSPKAAKRETLERPCRVKMLGLCF